MPTAAPALGDAGDRLLDVVGGDHHQVVELVDDDHDVRHVLVRGGVGSDAGRGLDLTFDDRRVVAGDVAEPDLGQDVVAALHLLDRPPQRVGGLLRVGDGLREQMRQPLILPHSTRSGSIRINRTWSGVVRISSEVMMQLMPLDLPAPVAPAIRRCGVVEMSEEHQRPAMSLPIATCNGCDASAASGDTIRSPSATSWRLLLGTSTPIADRPGMGARMRTSTGSHRIGDVASSL